MKRALLILSLLLATAAFAQQPANFERGINPSRLYDFHDIDHINTFNGNLVLTIPIGQAYPLGATSYQLTLTYNSQIWEFNEVTPLVDPPEPCCEPWAFPTRRSNAGLGWTLGFGRLLNQYDTTNHVEGSVFESPDGSEHRVSGPTGIPPGQAGYSTDGSYLRWRGGDNRLDVPDGTNRTFWPDGTVDRITDAHGNWVEVLEQTSNGNLTAWHIIDSVGRSHYVYFKAFLGDVISHPLDNGTTSQTNYQLVVDRVVLQTAGGNVTYQFHYANGQGEADLPTAVGESTYGGARGWPTSYNLPILRSIDLPDGTSYAAGYNMENLPSSGDNGTIMAVTLPTRAKIAWVFRQYVFPQSGCADHQWTYGTFGVGSRTVTAADGTTEMSRTTYVPANNPDTRDSITCLEQNTYKVKPVYQEATRTVTTEGRTDVLYYTVWPSDTTSSDGVPANEYGFPQTRRRKDSTDARYLSNQTYECNPTCAVTPARQTYIRYVGTPPDNTNQRIESERTLYPDGTYADLDRSDFDGFGHFRQESTGGNFTSGNSRTTYTNFNPGTDSNGNINGSFAFLVTDLWMINTYDQTWASEGGHATKAEYAFDTSTGFLQRVRRLKNDAASAGNIQRSVNDVVIQYSTNTDGGDTYGNVTKEQYYGGDTGSVGTGGLSGLSLGTPTYEVQHAYSYGVLASSQYIKTDNGTAMPFKTVDRTIHATGAILSEKDTTGLYTTTYTYDTSGRLSTITPPTGLAATTYGYTNASGTTPAQLTVATSDITSSYTYDGLGRVSGETQTLPGASTVHRATFYDQRGRTKEVTVWGTDAQPTNRTSHTYDAFDRPLAITAPDGAMTTYAYNGVQTVTRTQSVATATGATPISVRETYDRQGRLSSVTENAQTDPQGPTDQEVTTTYTYDVGGRLQGVSTPSPAGTQTRTFTYDNRGFLTSETQPELGSGGDGTTTYTDISNLDANKRGYDARGHAHRKITGTYDLIFTFDPAERVTAVTETATGHTLKAFLFDDPQGSTLGYCSDGSCKGKLGGSVKYHYDANLAPNGNIAVVENYDYHGLGGRESARYNTIGVSNNPTSALNVTFASGHGYNSIGRVQSTTYPCRWVNNACVPSERQSTITSTYTNGLLTSVEPYATDITYHPSGIVNTVTHGNGTKEITLPDPHGLARPCSISAVPNSATVAPDGSTCGFGVTGTSLWRTGAYAYDGSGNVKQIGDDNAEHTVYAYDAFGRLATWSKVAADTSYNSTTIAYDAFGNWRYNIIEGCGPNNSFCYKTSTAPAQLVGTTNHYANASYDDAGNLSGDPHRAFTYDATGVLTKAVVNGHDYRFLYTADGERLAAVERVGITGGTGNKTTFTLRGLDSELLTAWTTNPSTNTFTMTEDDVWRGTRLLARVIPNGAQHYALDHLGSPRLLTTSEGQYIGTQTFEPFGAGGTTGSGMLQFTGQERDAINLGSATTEMPDYFHARYYDVAAGRFLSIDPVLNLATAAKEPRQWNRYAYVVNNPIRWTDPEGRVIEYDATFRRRLKADVVFRDAFEAWKNTKAGTAQWIAMGQDANTTYRFTVGRVDAPTGLLRTEPANGRTLPVVSYLNENKNGKLNERDVTMTINADFVEGNHRNVPSMMAPQVAKALFEEAAHGLDIGSGTRSAAEAWAREVLFQSGTDPGMLEFERELKNIFP